MFSMQSIKSIAQPLWASWVWSTLAQHPNAVFISLFLFRYFRFVIHLVGYYFLYRPSPVSRHPSMTERSCTVIVPTCTPEDPAFLKCIDSIAQNFPKAIHIVTVGKHSEDLIWLSIDAFVKGYPRIRFMVSHTNQANKRQQVAVAVKSARTPLTVLCDDHVIWPSARFLRYAVAPFEEDPQIGGVGTKKRVTRRKDTGLFEGFWNVMGGLYLQRHNFEHAASNAVDGGVAVISGRTSLYRTHILQDPEVLDEYLNEMFFFGLFGPLAADDDNYLTRMLVQRGWKIKFQHTEEALILCDIGEYPKFITQCHRWARTTFRSNMCSLVTDRSIYKAQPWTVYALMIGQMVNFALFWDPLLVWTLTHTGFYSRAMLQTLIIWIMLTKLPKVLPYFWHYPWDLIYLPAYYLFAYGHSFIKLWALLTFWDVAWSGRSLKAIDEAAAAAEHDDQDACDQHPFAPLYSYDAVYEVPVVPGRRASYERVRHPASSTSQHPTQRAAIRSRRTATRTAQPCVSTPWGFVKAVNLPLSPANIRQSHMAGRSWPSGWSTRKRSTYQQQGYVGPHSPRALEFENRLARAHTGHYPTHVSALSNPGYN
jgi:cellulose synthase/poly-beta-1,6-N-acetylglucosamine synthase-like glycosyltransferase